MRLPSLWAQATEVQRGGVTGPRQLSRSRAILEVQSVSALLPRPGAGFPAADQASGQGALGGPRPSTTLNALSAATRLLHSSTGRRRLRLAGLVVPRVPACGGGAGRAGKGLEARLVLPGSPGRPILYLVLRGK